MTDNLALKNSTATRHNEANKKYANLLSKKRVGQLIISNHVN
jgi:hypothetical protein